MNEVNELTLSTSIFLIMLLVVACTPQVSVSASKGPREDDLQMLFYSDVLATYDALKAGDIDIVGFDIMLPVYLEAIDNPDVVLAPVDDMGMYEFDLNNNYSIRSYPGIRSPTNYKEFRQALAFLVDKDRVVEEFCDGFAARIDQPIAAPTFGWMNTSHTGANYPYEYNPVAASVLLDSAGFANATTANPYFDPGFPGSTTTLRTYPSGHSKAGQDLDDVVFYVRTDDPRRFQASIHLYENMRKIGIPVDAITDDWHWSDKVYGLRDFHIHAGSWSLGRFPTYLYYLYHTSFNIPYGSNYVHGIEVDGSPNHPLLDQLVYNVYYSDTFEEALKNTRNALGLFTELCVNIPLFSARSYWAYRSDLLGVVNMQVDFHDNEFMFLNAYKVDGSPIRWGHFTPPDDLNIMYYDWNPIWGASLMRAQCLERIYDWADHDLRPYDIVVDQPGFILDWTVSFWNDTGGEKAMLRKELRPDNYFVEAGSGLQLENVDVDTYLFSCYMLYASDPWDWDLVRPGSMEQVSFFEKISDYEVEIYFDTRRYWDYMVVSPQLLPMSIWLNTSKGLTVHHVDDVLGGAADSILGLDQPVWVNTITSNLTGTLTEWIDYRWERGDFVLLSDHVGELLTIDYYQLGNFSGYTPGDIFWREVESGSGMYYMTGYSPGVGGNFTARRNPYYYLETPVLGEVDFVWEDGGYYEVTIFDIVKAAGAYGSQGIAIPDRNWFPGADLAAPGGIIDVFDIVTIASAYGETFGAPPP